MQSENRLRIKNISENSPVQSYFFVFQTSESETRPADGKFDNKQSINKVSFNQLGTTTRSKIKRH